MARGQVLVSLCFLLAVAHAALFVEQHHSHHNATYNSREYAPGDEKIQVFVVTHSHDDMGWIYPVQQYYRQLTRYIIDSMVTSLHESTDRKFTQVEVGFFQMYWNEATEERRRQIRTIIERGQLEFNLGGYTMNDESTPTWYEEVNQMTNGALWLKQTFNVTAKSAWHIDPFGHSAATASLWSQIGFSGFGLNRIPYWLKDQMKQNKGLEFVWRGSKTLGKTSEIFAHVLDTWYGTPNEMDFNDNNGWSGIYIEDDASLPDYNVKSIADPFVTMVKQRSSWFLHKKLLIPFGNDFAHWQATNSFVNMDKLIKYVNDHSDEYGVTVEYAHLSDYVDAVHELDIEWPVFEGDFFPYNDGPNSFWSGYYTSRPWKKQYLRESDAKLASAEVAFAFLNGTESQLKKIDILRSATSVCTHHDAVSGTETDSTSADYDRRLIQGNAAVDSALTEMLDSGARRVEGDDDNIFYYSVFNQLGWKRKQYVSVLTNSSTASVTWGNSDVDFQINPVPSYSKVNAKYRLYFLVELDPLSSNVYRVAFGQPSNDKRSELTNSFLSLQFDDSTGFLKSITKEDGTSIQAELSLHEYRSLNGSNGLQASGAYIFRPDTQSVLNLGTTNNNQVTVSFDFASPRSGPYILLTCTDSFTTYQDSIISAPVSAGNQGFSLTARRLDVNGGWGQNPSVSFFAWSNGFPYKNFGGINYATGTATTNSPTLSVAFSSAVDQQGSFTAAPIVVVTPRAKDLVVATVTVVDGKGFTVQITDSNGQPYTGSVTVDYLAVTAGVYQDAEGKSSVQAGKVIIPAPTSGVSTVAEIDHQPTGQDSMVLVSSLGPSSYGFTVINKLSSAFSVVARRLNGQNGNLELQYIRLPRTAALLEPVAERVTNRVFDGPFVKEVQQFYKENYGQTLIQYDLKNTMGRVVEIVSEVGPLDVGGRELITRLSTSMKSEGKYYTDDNGLEVMERTYNSTTTELVAGNYHPMVQRVFMRDNSANLQLNLLSDSTHGAASLNDGELEVMLHRRCTSDDGRGVSQALNDQTPIRPTMWMTLTNQNDGTEIQRRLSILQQFPPTIVKVSAQANDWSLGATELPSNIHLMTVRSVQKGQLLVRIQHLFAKDEHPQLSNPVKINLKTLLGVKVNDIEEMNLSGIMGSDEARDGKLKWNTGNNNEAQQPIPIANGILVIQPMEIRTFLFSI